MVRLGLLQVILEKIKYDPYWDKKSRSCNPLQILALIKKTVLAQTEDQYPFTAFYKEQCSIYSFSQNTLIKKQWYARFNIKIDVGSDISVTRQQQVLLSHGV